MNKRQRVHKKKLAAGHYVISNAADVSYRDLRTAFRYFTDDFPPKFRKRTWFKAKGITQY